MADHAATDYQRGHMEISEQQSTFDFFVGMTKWGSLAVAAVVLFFTLLFCTPAGFLGAIVPAIVVVAVGIAVLREKPGSGH